MNHLRNIAVSISIVLVNILITSAQNIETSNITWDADEIMDAEITNSVKYTCQFKTNGRTVEWIQKKGEIKSTYNIVSTDGMWTDISKNGSIEYILERNGRQCKMILERTSSDIFITMYFNQSGEQSSTKKFHIKTVR
jgi:hypothetical protein